MGLLSFLRETYEPGTLDTRFVNPTSVPYKSVIETRDDPAAASKDRAAKWNSRSTTPKWNTPEYWLYFLILVPAVPAMLYIAYSASNGRRRTTVTPWNNIAINTIT